MLISVDEYYAGGRSVCRNPKIQRIFALIGRGERAGSGADTIAFGWNENHWPKPQIIELVQPDRVELTLLLTNTQNSTEDSIEKTIQKSTKKTSDKIVALMDENCFITISEIAERLSITPAAVNKQIRKLKDTKRIYRDGGDNGGHWVVLKSE